MSVVKLSISTFRPHHSPRWSQLKHHFNDWQRYARSRHELMNLSDRTLRDIGLSRCDAGFEASKPFWVA